ncbi:MAG: Holliday junction resolvase RuvX [Pseudomonadota bacterium]
MNVLDDVTALPRTGALVGLDPGTKTIGVAVSDGLRITASALQTIRRRKFGQDAEALRGMLTGRDIAGVVVGLPLNMDGSEGPRAQSSRAFARNVANALNLPVALWDERLTTAAAERVLLEADASRKRRKEVIDSLAAQLILQGALDRLATAAHAARDVAENLSGDLE